MRIGSREIGTEPYIIAEIGVNHDGQVERALALTEAAAEAGADAIKLQYFQAELLLSKTAKLAAYQRDAGETDPAAMLARLELDLADMALVIDRAHELGLHAIVTVFSVDLVAEACELGWDAFKTASPDLVHRPLLEALAEDGRPMIVSTGASTIDEVVRTAGWLDEARERVAMLQCVSCYPAPDAALGGVEAIARATGLPTGYSDHTEAVETGAMAVKAGACILERHITDDRTRLGPDHAASLDAKQFARYVELCRSASATDQPSGQCFPPPFPTGEVAESSRPEGVFDATRALTRRLVSGTAQSDTKQVLDCERDVRLVARQSIVARRCIEAGEVVTLEDLIFKRPGTGMEPWRVGEIVGRVLERAVDADEPIEPASCFSGGTGVSPVGSPRTGETPVPPSA
jgi:N,N'-diacetyllegionaminate synthase